MRACRTRPTGRIGIGRTALVSMGLAALVSSLLIPVAAHGGYWESFEGPLPSWQIHGGDVRYQLLRHERVDSLAHSGAWSESITVHAGGGSHLHATFDIPPVALIDELEAGLWVRADRPGMQLIARVVLPRSIDPATQKPITLLLHGSVYQTAGRWQRLELKHFPTQMARQTRIARSENVHRTSDSQQSFDTHEAYVDQIRLNIYGGRGTTTIAIDDLEINGYVEVDQRSGGGASAKAASTSVPSDSAGATNLRHPSGNRVGTSVRAAIFQEPSGQPTQADEDRSRAAQSRIAPVAWESSILAAEGKPLLPRIVQYRGESLAHLRKLGFNAVWLDNPPTSALLQEAVNAGMWMVCPGPSLDTPPFEQPLVPILSWHVGRELSRRDLRITAERVTHLRRIDGVSRRPICAQVASNLDAFSRHVDVLLLDRPLIGTSLDREGYFRWLTLSTQMARPGATFWARLHDRSPAAHAEQAAALGLDRTPFPVADWQQLRTMALGAIAHGVRGLVFASPSRLDARDPQTERRAAQFELLNQELSLIEPWAAAGRFVTTVESNDPRVKAYVLQSDHTRLVLPLSADAAAQASANRNGSSRPETRSLNFVVPGVPDANRAYELTLGGLRPLNSTRVAGGKSVAFDSGTTGSMIILTSDPRVTGRLNQRIAQIRKRAGELTHAVATHLARDTDAKLRASGRIPAAAVQSPLASASRSLRKSYDLLQRGDHHGNVRAAHAAMQAVETARVAARPHFGVLAHPKTTFSFPLENQFRTAPVLATTGWRLSNAGWKPNQLPGGDCENLTQMVQAGWRHVEFPQQGLATNVELSPHFPHSGRTSLHLRAAPTAGTSPPRLVESPPVWISTADVPVNAGEFVQIQGAVRVARPLQGSVDKLLVFDSLGGKDLALRMGAADSWQRFVIYRAVPQAGNVSVTFALSGAGEAWIDDVTIQTVRELPPLPARPTVPAGPSAAGSVLQRTPPPDGSPAVSLPPHSNLPPSRPSPPSQDAGPTDPFAGVPLH